MSKRASEENVTGPGPLTVGVLLIGLLLAISGTAPGRRFIEMLEGIKPLKSLSGALLRTEPVSDDKTSGALLDAVIAIVQSYYVDSDRTEAKVLLKGAVQDLAFAIPEVELIESDQMQTLKVKGKGLAISLNQDLSYDELLAHLKSLVKLCSAVHLETMVSLSSSAILGSEPNCSTMILNAVLSSLDAHSSLMSPDSYKDLRQGTDGSFGGLGVIVGVKNHQLTVIKPMPRSPALRAGLKKNDHIISIDGFSTFGLSLDQLVAHMKGDPGSIAQLSVLRPDSQFPISLPVRREIIEVDSVEARPHHKGQIHFLQLVVDSFSARTGKEVLAAIKLFRSKFPLHGVVLDLRSNPGGLLDQAIEVSDIFLKSGIIVSTRGRRDEIERATRGVDETDFPLIVLMNEDSASASEIVAGALQDSGRAIVVGQPSFGKGSVQTLFELPAERALKLTIARYYTPSGQSIQNIGIMPDVWIQPMRRRSENRNLFGPYRYHSEAFLPNHLQTAVSKESHAKNEPLLKGFYLRREEGESEIDSTSVDDELDLATTILSKSFSTYGPRLPESAQRASHLLAISLGDLRTRIAEQSNEASEWLQKSHRVAWAEKSLGDSSLLRLRVEESSITSKNGNRFMVPWEIKNNGAKEVRHISVFIQAVISGIETVEHLVGDLGAQETKRGFLEIEVPASLPHGKHRLVAGLAKDATSIASSLSNFSIALASRMYAELNVTSTFTDAPNTARNNKLDPGESGAVLIGIKNTSGIELRDAELEIVNLAGSQVKIGQLKNHKFSISKGESLNLEIPIVAGQRIESDIVSVGYILKSPSLESNITKIIDIKSTLGIAPRIAVDLTH